MDRCGFVYPVSIVFLRGLGSVYCQSPWSSLICTYAILLTRMVSAVCVRKRPGRLQLLYPLPAVVIYHGTSAVTHSEQVGINSKVSKRDIGLFSLKTALSCKQSLVPRSASALVALGINLWHLKSLTGAEAVGGNSAG